MYGKEQRPLLRLHHLAAAAPAFPIDLQHVSPEAARHLTGFF
jgi:hypothetical protein